MIIVAYTYKCITYVVTDSDEIYTPSAGERTSAWRPYTTRRCTLIQTSHTIDINA